GLGLLSEALDTVTLKLGGRYSEETVDSSNPSIVIAAGGRGPVIRHTTASTFVKRSFSDFTPEIGLSWEPTPDVMLYYTYSEGFKAGSGENASGSRTIVDPEMVQNHEAGIKATLFGGFSANLAAYTYDLEGAQLNKTIAGGRSEEHTSELQSRENLVCRLLLEKKKQEKQNNEDDVRAEIVST